MNISLFFLTALIILLMFGAGQRVLDGMRLNDKQAILVLLAMAIGIAIPPIWIGKYFAFSIGGFVIPYIICIYMLISCGWSRDLLRACIGTILVAGIIYALEWLLPSNTAEDIVIDNTFLYGIVAGIVAYVLGRSRRNAFICSVFGISLAQIVQWVVNFCLGAPTVLGLGVGRAFGTYVIAILISVGLAEFFGRAFEGAKPDEGQKVFNYNTHTYDSQKNGKLVVAPTSGIIGMADKTAAASASLEIAQAEQSAQKIDNLGARSGKKSTKKTTQAKNKATAKAKTISKKKNSSAKKVVSALVLGVAGILATINISPAFACTYAVSNCPNCKETATNMASVATATSETNESNANYFTVYDYADRATVVLVKGGEVEDGDLYLSSDNKLYQICNVNSSAKTAYAKFIREESLPKYNITGTKKTTTLAATAKTASAKSTKTVGLYHTHNDESYIDVDGTDSVYGEGGIHDVGARLKENLQKLDISVLYDTTLHLPHNSGAYTRSLSTAQKLLDDGANAIFDVHRDSTPRSEYVTTVNGEQMSKIRMVVGSANQNYAENKNLAYSIKAYADEVYPNLIKDIYMGSGNYNQQLSPLAMLFEFGSENVEKELVLASTEPLSKIIDVVVFGSENASAISLADVSLSNGDGTTTVIAGLSNANSGASLTSLWVILACLGIAVVILGAVCIFSRTARYHTARFFSELFPFFRKK